MTNPTDPPLIHTTKGNLPVDILTYSTAETGAGAAHRMAPEMMEPPPL